MADDCIWIGENAFADVMVGTVDGGRSFWVPQEDKLPIDVSELGMELQSVLDNQVVSRINENTGNEMWRLNSALPFAKFTETSGLSICNQLLGPKSAHIFGKEQELLSVPVVLRHLATDIRFLLAEIVLKVNTSGNSALAEELLKSTGLVSHLTYQVFQEHADDMNYWNTRSCSTVWDWLIKWTCPVEMDTATHLYLTSLYIDKTPPEIDDELWRYIRNHLDIHEETQKTAEVFGLFDGD